MTEYENNLPTDVAFPPQEVTSSFGQAISQHGLRQLRICESEKERFVTYYFNGLRETAFPNEDRVIIPSPKVSTYDKQPEMSAFAITDRIQSEIKKNIYDLIIVNFANADMVGHTGNLTATVKACEAVDICLGNLKKTILDAGGCLIITADHGNAEEMINLSTGGVDTEHNANPVPFIIITPGEHKSEILPQGILADIAPTILYLLQISLPFSMSGRNLLISSPHP